jgi:GAF domain-containing protein
MTREAKFARTLVELADTLVTAFDVVELLTALADRCVDVLDVGAAGIMLVAPDGNLRVMASSSEAMRLLELFELHAQEGPCLDCYRTGNQADLATINGRWPRFAAEALAAGFHSAHALPMRLRGSVIGALNLFHLEPGEMRQTDIERAQALADVATIAILQHPPCRPRGPGPERAAPPCAHQLRRHRAGQGDHRRATALQHGAGVLGATHPRS